ncbi:MAG: ribbon-helix-helix domain-containing protein [Alphaproteobacteria bacterium]|nr:ribbon-helix-helix domain-containing protein [Alphaproteobacteria bacterium]
MLGSTTYPGPNRIGNADLDRRSDGAVCHEEALKAIAAGHRCTVNDLVTRIDRQRSGNLSSAIRVFVLETLSQRTHGRG